MKHAYGVDVPETLAEVCAPDHCALILYDMQMGIVSQLSDGDAIVSRCATLLSAARSTGMRVFFLRHLFLPNVAAGAGQLRRAMIWQRQGDPASTTPFILQGSAAWEIVPALAPLPGEVQIDKITMSAFEGTFLNIALRDTGITSFLIAGIALEIGIEPTVRHGLDLNYVPVVATDACGAKTEALKIHSLATLKETGEVFMASVDEIIAALPSANTD